MMVKETPQNIHNQLISGNKDQLSDILSMTAAVKIEILIFPQRWNETCKGNAFTLFGVVQEFKN